MQGKVVLITGAASGIARATALVLAGRGCRLALVDKNEQNLQSTLQSCLDAGSKQEHLLLITADLAVDGDLKKIVDTTIAKFNQIDVLLNVAGLIRLGNLAETTEDDYDVVMNVNMRAIIFLTKLVMPHLIATKGNVVNVSSVGSMRPAVGAVVYCMSKAALDQFTRTVALEVAKKGVRVNSVNPSNCNTSFLPGLDVQELGRKLHALGRLGEPEDIAKSIVFLADDETGSFITGTNFLVDGGMYLMGAV